jgi:GT2 family glycosyltransferase
MEAEIAVQNARIKNLETRLASAEADLQLRQSELDTVRHSFAWRLVQFVWRFQMRLFPYGTRRRNIYRAAVLRVSKLIFKEGAGAEPLTQEAAYRLWIQRNEPDSAQLKNMEQTGKRFAYRPTISIVVPVYQTPQTLLRAAIESVRSQIYDRWELCLADDGSDRPDLTEMLRTYSHQDPRIRFTQLPQSQGISQATNAAMALGRGEFIGFLDHDDTLSPDALYRVVELLQKYRDADLIYSDEDKLGPTGERYDVFFKPDWSPDLLLSMNYICHFLVIRRSLVETLGSLRSECDGSQDYDLILRSADHTTRIHHVPRVLYHWRAAQNSTAQSPSVKPTAHLAARRAIGDYLERNHIRATVEPGVGVGRWRVRYEVVDNPKVTVIMPTGGRLELLQPCLESIFAETGYPNYEILLLDNSRGPEVAQYASAESTRWNRLRYLDYRNRPFNFSTLNNDAVRTVDSPLILFLNDDMTVRTPEWLTAMVEHGQRPSVGAVGAKLVYPSGSIQHGGVFMGVYGNTGHAFKYLPADSRHYFDLAQVIRDSSAVTAACLLTRREVFWELNGFDEKNLPVAFQDVDYCLRLCKAGYSVVYTPHAVLTHHESMTKAEKHPNFHEVRYMQKTWADVIAHDPYYSPHLSRRYEDYRIRVE